MSEDMLKGVYAVVPTTLKEDEGLDSRGLQHLIDYYIESGCHGLLILGSGGEFPYFSYAEKTKIVQDSIAAVNGRVPLLVGAGFMSHVETMAFVGEVGERRIDGFLVITPTFFPAGFDDVYKLYSQICGASKKPVLYYHYPQMTGLFFSPEEISRLLSIEGMLGMKDSIINIAEIEKHIKSSPKAVFAGNSFEMQKVVDVGGSGFIEVTSSFAPGLVVDCYNACLEKDVPRAEKLQEKILDLMTILSSFKVKPSEMKKRYKAGAELPVDALKNRNASRSAVVKETLRQLGHPITSKARSPQPQVTDADRQAIVEIIKENQLSM